MGVVCQGSAEYTEQERAVEEPRAREDVDTPVGQSYMLKKWWCIWLRFSQCYKMLHMLCEIYDQIDMPYITVEGQHNHSHTRLDMFCEEVSDGLSSTLDE